MKNIFILFIFILSCRQAKFNSPVEGASGLILGLSPLKLGISVSGNKESILEGETVEWKIKLTQPAQNSITVNIESNSSDLILGKKTLMFSPQNSTTEQTLTLTSANTDKVQMEKVSVSFSGTGIQTVIVNLNIMYQLSRKITLDGAGSITEETSNILKIKLGKKPLESITVNVESADSGKVILNKSSFTFSPDNYDTFQNLDYSINDQINENKNYIIRFKSDSDIKDFSVNVIDTDYVFRNIGLNQNTNSGMSPSSDIDVSSNLILTTVISSGQLLIYSCNLNSDSCSVNAPGKTASYAATALDKINKKYYIHYKSGSDTYLYSCNYDHSSCVTSSALLFGNVYNVKVKVNEKAGGLSEIAAASEIYRIVKCNFNLSSCVNYNYDLTQPSIGTRGVFMYNGVFFFAVSSTSGSNYANPVGLYFDMTLNTSASLSYSFDPYSMVTADFSYNPSYGKYYFAGNNFDKNGQLWTAVCNDFDLNCTVQDVSGGIIARTFFPKIHIDYLNQKLFFISYDLDSVLFISKCDFSAQNCKSSRLSIADRMYTDYPVPAQAIPFDSVLDTQNNRILIFYPEHLTGKLTMIRFGLGGF